jgi:hypothetical protein
VKNYSLTHLSDECLRRELSTAAAKENEASAELLAHIAEFDDRKLYLRAAYPSMIDYCTGGSGCRWMRPRSGSRWRGSGGVAAGVFHAQWPMAACT